MYKARIIRANTFLEHPNADRLKILMYNGMSFIVGKDLEPGTLVCLFLSDGQLSHEFCYNNSLYRDSSKNRDTSKSGFFEDNRRVRIQPFRGVKSEGYVCELDFLKWTGKIDGLVEGFEFETLNGKPICSKYYSQVSLDYMRQRYGTKHVIPVKEYDLAKHSDTDHLRLNLGVIPEDSICYITEKIHGTSGRTGFVKTQHNVTSKLKRFVNFLLGRNSKITYEYVSGTRNTIINDRKDIIDPKASEHYRWEVHESLVGKLRRGETIYYEIVGYDNNGMNIMPAHNTTKLKNKDIQQRFGTAFGYRYGTNRSSKLHDIFVYRINYAGQELSFINMLIRCNELGLKAVPLLGIVMRDDIHMFSEYSDTEPSREKHISDSITERVDQLLVDGPSFVDSSHLMEGICVRVESKLGMKIYKQKNYAFAVLEDIIKEQDDYIDKEEVS